MFAISVLSLRGRVGRGFRRAASASLIAALAAAMLGLSITAAAASAHRAAATVAGRLEGVSCASSKSCVAVGQRSATSSSSVATLAEKWNGTKWSVVKSPDPAGSTAAVLDGVACTSANSCVAVGDYFASSDTLPTAEKWNGTKWSVLTVPAPSGATDAYLEAVSCASAKNCQAVGASGDNTLAESWNGSKWTIVSSPSPVPSKPNYLTGVACPASSECWAVGYYFPSDYTGALTEKWNGSKWSVVKTPYSSSGEPIGDGCFSESDCMTVGIGDNLFAIAQRWNGTSWAKAAPKNPSGATSSELTAVSCPSGTACESVGNYTDSGSEPALAEGWNGTKWAIQSTPGISGSDFASLAGVSCVAAGNCWTVGVSETSTGAASPVIEHWNGKSWSVSAS